METVQTICPHCGNVTPDGNYVSGPTYAYRIRTLVNKENGDQKEFLEVYCTNCHKTLMIQPT